MELAELILRLLLLGKGVEEDGEEENHQKNVPISTTSR